MSIDDCADFEKDIVQNMFYSCFILSKITRQFEVCWWGVILMSVFKGFDCLLHGLRIEKLRGAQISENQQPI